MNKSLTVFICVTTLLVFNNVFGQKVNPDLEKIPIKNKLETVFNTENAVNFQHIKIALDSKEKLHAVYCDPYNGKTYYSTNMSGAWETAELISKDENDGYAAMYPAIAIEKNDNIHVVFTRYKDKLIYGQKKVSDEEWTFSEINSNNTDELVKFYVFDNYIDMCTDDNGGVHVIISGDGHDLQGKSFHASSIYFYKPANGKLGMHDYRKRPGM